MSWICKRCETENPDTVDVCEVCDAQAPVLRNLKYELDLVYGNINLLGELAHWDSINVDGEWKKAGSKYRMYIKEDERLEIQIPIEELIQNKEENFNIVISYTNINTTRLLEKSLSFSSMPAVSGIIGYPGREASKNSSSVLTPSFWRFLPLILCPVVFTQYVYWTPGQTSCFSELMNTWPSLTRRVSPGTATHLFT